MPNFRSRGFKLSPKTCFLFIVLPVFGLLNAGCDLFSQDPKETLYRPSAIKIEDSSGHLLSKLSLPVNLSSHKVPAQSSKFKTSLEIDSQWGKDPVQTGVTEPFSDQETPYIGGDNCLNSVFFDVIGIPYSRDPVPVYQPASFYKKLQGYVKEPANFFFYDSQFFLKESTFPYYSKNHLFIVGDQVLNQGTNQALDRFYQDRLQDYHKKFNGKIISFKISCQYPSQTMGSVKEEILLQMMESEKSLIFLADKEIHLVTRKDRSLRYVSEFMISKDYFPSGELQFKEK